MKDKKNIKPFLLCTYIKQLFYLLRCKGKKPKNLILFIVPGEVFVNGGVMSFHMHAEIFKSQAGIRLKGKTETLLISINDSKTHYKNPFFKSKSRIVSPTLFLKVFNNFKHLNIIVNIPPIYLEVFNQSVIFNSKITKSKKLTFNILNQNNENMPNPTSIAYLAPYRVTQTVAFEANCNTNQAERYKTPITFIPPIPDRVFEYVRFTEKVNRMMISPDSIQEKKSILDEIGKKTEIKTFNQIAHEEYLKLVEKSRYMLTLGEGFDYYFVESFLTGGIAFSIYNDQFFPNDTYRNLKTVFESADDMLKNIGSVLVSLSDPTAYESYNKQVVEKIKEKLSHKYYKGSVGRYLLEEFDVSYIKPESP